MTPVEFVIPQRPVSQQARRRERVRESKDFVAEHARGAVGPAHEVVTCPVALRLLYLYDEVALDVDSVVTDVEIRRRWRGATFTLNAVSPVLAAGLELEREFVLVSLTDAPPQDVLP